MDTANLLFLINSFSKTEAREVRRFLQSPFFNLRDDLRVLFDFLFDNENPQKEGAWSALFPEKKYDDTAMRLLMSYLNRLLEQYLTIKENDRDDLRNKLQLAVAYRRRGLPGQYSRHLKALEKGLDGQPLRNLTYWQWFSSLNFEKLDTQTTENPTGTDAIRESILATDVHYFATRLRLLCLEAAQKNVYRLEENPATDRDIVALVRRENWENFPAIRLYLLAFEMLTKPTDDVCFQNFSAEIRRQATAFLPHEMREFYYFAINHCVRRLNDGSTNFAHEALNLYKSALEKGFLFENQVLSRFTFHNIVAAGLRTGDLTWVRFFIEKYGAFLEKKYRESSGSFNLARLEFAEGKHGSVLQLLQNANYRDPLLHLAAKVLLVKTCHVLGELDLLASQLDAMKNYLHRSEVIGYHKTNYLNFARFLDKALTVNRLEKRAVEKLRQQISDEPVLSERAWLLGIL